MFKLSAPETPLSALSERQLRAATALIEAIIPGNDTVRPADERTVAMTERVVEHVGPLALKAWIAAIEIADRAAILAKGRRFSALSRADQQLLLDKWDRDPLMRLVLFGVAFATKFTHFDTQDVYERMGGKLNVVHNVEQPRWLSQITRAETWTDGDIECEVVVVGTGAGGAVVGKELADRGYAVCFVEEGGFHQRDSFTGSSLQAHFDFYRGSVTVGNVIMPIFAGRLVGGSTAINTGSCFRTPEHVLERWCESTGTDELGPSKLEPMFERVEKQLQVGLADRRYVGPIADIMERGCDALGWSHRLMPRNAPGCQGEGFCDFGCRTDARKSTNLSYIPPALEKGSMLFTNLRAERVIVENGRAVGLECTAVKNGKRIRVRSRAVILAAGALPTPILLLKQGLANSSGQVGKNLTVHPSTALGALFDQDVSGHKYMPQGYYSDEFLREGILLNTAQPDKNLAALIFPFTGQRLMQALSELDHVAFFGGLIADTGTGVVHVGPGGMPIVRYSLQRADIDLLHRSLVLLGRMSFAAGAKKLYPVCVPAPVIHTPEELERFARMKLKAPDLMLTSYHPLGSCKMGKDPRKSVVNPDHESHDVPGLFIVDGSTVPGPLGVNPQITIMAMATRAADKIAERLS